MKVARLYSPHGGFIREWQFDKYEPGDFDGFTLRFSDNRTVDMVPVGSFVLIIEEAPQK